MSGHRPVFASRTSTSPVNAHGRILRVLLLVAAALIAALARPPALGGQELRDCPGCGVADGSPGAPEPPPVAEATPSAPTVAISPASGSWTGAAAAMQLAVTITWCDTEQPLNAPGREVLLDGERVSLPWASGSGGCGTSSASITLEAGTHTLEASIENQQGVAGSASAVYTYTVVAPPPEVVVYGVATTPDGGAVQAAAGAPGTAVLSVMNSGSAVDSFAVSVQCFDRATACSLSQNRVTLPAGGRASVAVNLTAGPVGSGRIRLEAVSITSASARDTGSVSLTVSAVPLAGSLGDSVALGGIYREACVSVSLTDGAASECGDLRLVHALPTTTVLGRPRTPVLLYNSDHARPYPILARYFNPPPDRGTPTSVVATATILDAPGGAYSLPSVTFPGWAPGSAANRRLAVGFDASTLPTGVYRYQLSLVANYPAGPVTFPGQTGELIVVNRVQSAFGAGWWLAGLERLHFISGNRILWVAGDGSARIYSPVATNKYAARSYTGPDTVEMRPEPNPWGYLVPAYVRTLPGGSRVVFSADGLHARTENSLGHSTRFSYDGSGRLARITLPLGAQGYDFAYANGVLATVTAPGPAGCCRLVQAHNDGTGRVVRLVDPVTTTRTDTVAFGYGTDGTARVVSRTDRMGVRTDFAYNAGWRVSSSTIQMGTGVANLVLGFPAVAQTRGLVGTGGSVSSLDILTQIDGPRTDTADVTTFYVDRYGAPTRVLNPRGQASQVYREDGRFPGLVTRSVQPNGRTITAGYDARGNLVTQTDRGTSLGGRFATSTYEYDPRWDAVTRSTSAEGEVSLTQYDSVGRVMWTQVGHDAGRRVTYQYHGVDHASWPGLLRTATAPITGRDSVEHDAMGNVRATVSPMGTRVEMERDAIGRVTVVRSPTSAGTRHDSTSYDLQDRPIRVVNWGPASQSGGAGEQKLVITTKYDREGRTLSVSRRPFPDPAEIDSVTSTYQYDRAGRQTMSHNPGTASRYSFYSPGGMVDSVKIGSRVIRMRYDGLGRLVSQITPSVDYAPSQGFIQSVYAQSVLRQYTHPHQPFTGRADGHFVIPEDTASFAYDAMGNMTRADNRDARVRRVYDPMTGALLRDSIYIRDWAGSGPDPFARHRYGQEFTYDLNGRRTLLRVDSVVAPVNEVTGQRYREQTYSYDPVTGALSSVRDLLGNQFRFTYDAEGRPDSIVRPGGNVETLTYDNDGQLTRRIMRSPTFSAGTPDKWIQNQYFEYTADGKLWTMDEEGDIPQRGAMSFGYSGLGMLTFSNGRMGKTDTNETFVTDALGHFVERWTTNQPTPQLSHYFPGTDKIDWSGPPEQYAFQGGISPNEDQSVYDAYGNVILARSGNTWSRRFQNTASYYGADGKLRGTDTRQCYIANFPRNGEVYQFPFCSSALQNSTADVFEEYRYDALGRRVLVRTRRDHNTGQCSGCSSSITRTIWDGDQVLAEIRSNGAGNADLENDNETGYIAYGRVFHTHAGGIDQPLSVIRVGYTPTSLGADWEFDRWGGPWAVIPITDYRGSYIMGTAANGRWLPCETPSATCTLVVWPGSGRAYYTENEIPSKQSWFGSVITGSADASGFMYRRNRYYNPATGSFTQSDPIGIDGGLNTYGYAGGDPVSFGDPYGLDPCEASAAWTDCIAQGISRWGGENRSAVALYGGAILSGVLEASGFNAAASAGDHIGNGRVARGGLEAGIVIGGGIVGRRVAGAIGRVVSRAGRPAVTRPYVRPSGATTRAQRAAVQGQPCARCGAEGGRRIAGHKRALVQEHYETGQVDVQRARSLDAVQPECVTCSAREGAEMMRYSQQQRRIHGFPEE